MLTNLSPERSIIYAFGGIVDNRDINNASGTVLPLLDKVRADSTVKAVVLRVNSRAGALAVKD